MSVSICIFLECVLHLLIIFRCLGSDTLHEPLYFSVTDSGLGDAWATKTDTDPAFKELHSESEDN